MGTLTVRNLDDNVKLELRKRAAENGRSLEAEVRATLTQSVAILPKPKTGAELWQRIRDAVGPEGLDLEIPARRRLVRPRQE